MFKGLMTGVSGVRGIVGEGMTPEIALLWSSAFGTWLKGKKVLLARDSRPSGEMLSHAVKAGLSAAGCDIEDIGIVPTPTAAYAVKVRGAGGGIIITASHNPQEWNALKFVRNDGRMLTASDFAELETIVKEGPLRTVKWDKLGTITQWDSAGYVYLRSVTGLSFLNLEKLHGKKLKVAIDCVNGAGSVLYPQLLESLGCEVVSIHCDNSGIFVRGPEPVPQNLSDLSKLVTEERCTVGFAVDPDGDRLAIIDEHGKPIGEEMTLALAVKAVLEDNLGTVVVNSLTTKTIDDICEQFGVECHRTRVGEANVSARMLDVNAVVGGEGNGGLIYPELHLVRDAGVGMALLLNRLSATKKTVSQLVGEIPSYKMLKSAVPIRGSDPHEIVEYVAKKYEHDQISRIDGLKVFFNDGWVQVRPSNTEPILRVFAEAVTDDRVNSLLKDMNVHISRAIEESQLNG